MEGFGAVEATSCYDGMKMEQIERKKKKKGEEITVASE
jgi:hypothetical protein